AVVGEPVDLVLVLTSAHLGDHDLGLQGFGLGGEDRTHRLGVGIGQGAGVHVCAVVGVAAQIRVAHARHPQVLELVVLAHGGETDPVIDLADLVQGTGGVLGQERDAFVISEHHHRPATGDPLAGEVCPVLHQLFGRDVEGLGHAREFLSGSAWISSATAASSAGGTVAAPWSPTVFTTGSICRAGSGPPVAVSSSAASIRACMATRTACWVFIRGCQSFFIDPWAYTDPEPTLW